MSIGERSDMKKGGNCSNKETRVISNYDYDNNKILKENIFSCDSNLHFPVLLLLQNKK